MGFLKSRFFGFPVWPVFDFSRLTLSWVFPPGRFLAGVPIGFPFCWRISLMGFLRLPVFRAGGRLLEGGADAGFNGFLRDWLFCRKRPAPGPESSVGFLIF